MNAMHYASLTVVSGNGDGNGNASVVAERLTLVAIATRRRHCGGPCTRQELIDRAFGEESQPQRDVVKDEKVGAHQG